MDKHNGLCISDRLEQGWIIEGYPEPLSEQRCEEIAASLKIIETQKSAIAHLEKRLREANEVIAFYSDPPEARDFGARAREYQRKYEVKNENA